MCNPLEWQAENGRVSERRPLQPRVPEENVPRVLPSSGGGGRKRWWLMEDGKGTWLQWIIRTKSCSMPCAGVTEATDLSFVCFVVFNPVCCQMLNKRVNWGGGGGVPQFIFLPPPPHLDLGAFCSINCPIFSTLEWWDAVLQKRLAWALFVLLLSTLVCCQPTELIWVFLFHKFHNFTPPPPLPAVHVINWMSWRITRTWPSTTEAGPPRTTSPSWGAGWGGYLIWLTGFSSWGKGGFKSWNGYWALSLVNHFKTYLCHCTFCSFSQNFSFHSSEPYLWWPRFQPPEGERHS